MHARRQSARSDLEISHKITSCFVLHTVLLLSSSISLHTLLWSYEDVSTILVALDSPCWVKCWHVIQDSQNHNVHVTACHGKSHRLRAKHVGGSFWPQSVNSRPDYVEAVLHLQHKLLENLS